MSKNKHYSRGRSRIRKAREQYILAEYFNVNRKYEFETADGRTADIFLQILQGFHMTPEDMYISEKNIDYSQINFRTTRKKRLQIEYTLREFLKLPPVYLMEVDHTESSLEITCNDGYCIF